jgi:hypothetical protein
MQILNMDQFPINTLGKILIAIGGIIILVGLVLVFVGKIPFIGKLPGDISIKGKSFSVYFPIVTCLILSIILTLIFNLFFRK